ncbi:Ada metal-binding domain-containing protein [Flagellimonas flava]|uniref:Metal binding domain of Ada n=1 Tax=Flagellimonas flava TaxID=570519 RepID=A0A1M5M7A6_9FLAO|nr:Ada metal-binding domain-containing protein [Allomuricauda flava]SHG73115.1 Metal binding domain of Ada [Allomuricauda flava]
MFRHDQLSKPELFHSLKHRKIKWAGNRKLKIYGTLQCGSGKRMKMENRVFFTSEEEAIHNGYRPCGHCMRKAYLSWKNTKL